MVGGVIDRAAEVEADVASGELVGGVSGVGGDAGVADEQFRHAPKCVPFVGRSPARITERTRLVGLHVELAHVGTDDQRIELVIGAISSEGLEGGSVAPALVDVHALRVGHVGADGEVVAAGRIPGEHNGFTRTGEEDVTIRGCNAKVAGDDDHRPTSA